VKNDIDLEPRELGGDLGHALVAAFRPAIVDRHVATFDPLQLAKALHESGKPWAGGGERGGAEITDGRQLALLRARGQRPCGRRAAEQRDEIASPHRSPSSGRGPQITNFCWRSVVAFGFVQRSPALFCD